MLPSSSPNQSQLGVKLSLTLAWSSRPPSTRPGKYNFSYIHLDNWAKKCLTHNLDYNNTKVLLKAQCSIVLMKNIIRIVLMIHIIRERSSITSSGFPKFWTPPVSSRSSKAPPLIRSAENEATYTDHLRLRMRPAIKGAIILRFVLGS